MGFSTDIRHAVRSLRKHPLQSAILVFLIAVGVGASSALYSIEEDLLWRPASYDPGNQLVDIGQRLEPSGAPLMNWHQNLNELRDHASVLEGVSAYKGAYGTIATLAGPKYAQGMAVDRHFFPLLGVRPILGRSFTASNERPSTPCTVILSNHFWRQNFGGDTSTLGKSLLIDHKICTVIGIMPQSFSFPFKELAGTDPDFWLPLQDNALRRDYDKYGIARMRPGRTFKEAQVEASLIGKQLSRKDTGHETHALVLQHYREVIMAQYIPLLHLFGGVLTCLLLVICVNAAGLLFVEAIRNQKDFQIRFALGGTRWQITRVFLMRVLTLAAIGEIGGVALAAMILTVTRGFLSAQLSIGNPMNLDTKTLSVAIAAAFGTAVLSGLWPALVLTRDLNRPGGFSPARGGSLSTVTRSRSYIAMLQLGLSAALLTVTGLLGINLYKLLTLDPGMQLDHRIVLIIKHTDYDSRNSEQLRTLYSTIREQFLSVPAIKEVALSSDVPLGPHLTRNFRLRDVPPPSDPDEWIAEGREISANYLHTLGIKIRLGRGFNETHLGGKPVAVVNQAFVRQFLRGKMALSTQICVPSGTECIWREIVGVAADVRDTRVDSPPESAYFIPFSQAPKEFMADAVFTLLTVESPVAVQKELYALKMPPNTVTTAPFTLEQIREMQTESQRARLPVLAGMGVLALFLAAMGVYGIVAATIASRRREIGIRIAVGASPQIIQRLFIRKMSYTVGVGLFMGAYGAALMMRFMNGATWSLSETALATYCGAAFVVSIAAAVATLVAARSALAGNPSDSLRSEP